MTILRAMAVAFSTYSRVPVPYFEWKKSDIKYSLCFFPVIGVIIGVCTSLWCIFAGIMGINVLAYSLVTAAIPIIITGGYHVDGFMDTMDAVKSYGNREERLRILSDPHIGAFSVIMLALYYMIYIAAVSTIRETGSIIVMGICFVISRALSGLSLLYFRMAKETGSLDMVRQASSKKAVTITLSIIAVIGLVAALLIDSFAAAGMAVGAFIAIYYYRHMSYKEFGGITGDLAGYFVCISELLMIIGITLAETIGAYF